MGRRRGEGGGGGGGVWRWGKREMEIIYLSLHCHHQNDSCIKPVGSDESHFNVSSIVRDKATRQYPQTITCEDGERRAEAAGSNRGPSAYQRPNALLLGQSGSRVPNSKHWCTP